MPALASFRWLKPMKAFQDTEFRGRKPKIKEWDTRLRYEIGSNYASDSATHILLFLAGDRAQELFHRALQDFANALDIPINDPEFHHAVFMQAASMQAASKRAPFPSDVIAALGRNDVLDTLHRALDNQGKERPAPKPVAVRTPAAPQSKPYVAHVASAVQTKTAPPASLPSVPAPVAVAPTVTPQPSTPVAPVVTAPVVSAPVQRKPLADIDMGPELDLDTSPAEPSTGVDAVKNRWLAAHDY